MTATEIKNILNLSNYEKLELHVEENNEILCISFHEKCESFIFGSYIKESNKIHIDKNASEVEVLCAAIEALDSLVKGK